MFSVFYSLPSDAPFFIGLVFFNTLILFTCHIFRNRLTLGPLFATAGAMTLLFWQMRHIGWWLQWNTMVVDTASVAFVPPLLMGLLFCYAFDGIRAARSYVSVLIFTSLLGWGFAEFRDSLAHYIPIPYVFYLSTHSHFSTIFALFFSAVSCLTGYEVLRKSGRFLAFSLTLPLAVFCYVLTFSLVEYSWRIGFQNCLNALPGVLTFTLIPVLFSCFYCFYAIVFELYLPVRSVNNILFFWRTTGCDAYPSHQDFLDSGRIISDLQQLNNQLKETQRLNEYHIKLSPLAIVITDTNAKILSANPAAENLYSQPQEQLVKTSVTHFFNGRSLSQVLNNTNSLVVSFISPSRQEYWHEYTTIPLYDGYHKLRGYQFIIKDVTLTKRLQFKRKIEDRVRNIHQTGKMFSHDISNLFLGIQGGLAQVKTAFKHQDTELFDSSCKHIASALSQGRNMLQSLNSEQSFSTPSFSYSHLNQIINEAINICKARATQAQIEILFSACADPVVNVDSSQLSRVLTNLLINAIRASSPGDSIRLSVVNSEKGITIKIVDQGKGMSESQLLHAFDPGFSTKGSGQGGLGLAISYLIIEAHGGLLKLYANTNGSGITAEIWLPCDGRASSHPLAHKNILLALPENTHLLTPLSQKLSSIDCQWSESQGMEEFLAMLEEPWNVLLVHQSFLQSFSVENCKIPIIATVRDDLSITAIKGDSFDLQ